MIKQLTHNLKFCRQLMFFLLLILPLCVYSQSNLVQGTVYDNNGKPIKGVRVKTNNSSPVFITSDAGQFSVNASENDILMFSHPDFYNSEVRYKKQSNFIVQLFNRYLPNPSGKTLSADTLTIEETPKMVTILHGQQPVGNLIQSVGTINSNQLSSSPSWHIMQALPGRLAGLNVNFYSGGPALDNNTTSGTGTNYGFNIRGSRAQTILIDGVERGYASLDPEQIESISVLKDALSTIMFGMRSSNGIVMITTKKGDSGTPRISVTAQSGIETPTALPKPLSAWQYATLFNEAKQNDAGTTIISPSYSDADIAAYKDHTDPYGHPDVDWYNTVLNKNAVMNKCNFNVQGSGNGFRYFVDMDYYQERGLLKTSSINSYNTNTQLDRYLLRSNIGADVTKTTTVQFNLFGRFQRFNQPGGGVSGLFSSLMNTPQNAYPVTNLNGSIAGSSTYQQNTNIWGQAISRGYQFQDDRDMAVDLQATQKLDFVLPGLYLKAQGSYNNTTYYTTNRAKDFAVFQYNTTSKAYTQYGTTSTQSTSGTANDRFRVTYLEANLGYDKTFGKHSVNASFLADQQSKLLFSTANLPENYTDYAGRFNYNYDNRYLAEVAGSYSGYSYFPSSTRWASYWAAGLGWNIHNESFVKDKLKIISNLKLRCTYGMTGQANVSYGNYIQQYGTWDSSTNIGDAYFIGTIGAYMRGSFAQALVNTHLSPERAKKLNLGLDLGLWNNRLTFTGDYYYNKFYDLIAAPTYTSVILGATYPNLNFQKNDYWGTDLTATWQDHVKNFNYFITANLSVVQSKVVYTQELYKDYDYQVQTGRQVGLRQGYIATGLYKSYDEINDPNTAVLPAAPKSSLRPGDIRYMDRNNDGVIDGKDWGTIGSGKPNMYYGATIGFNYKGIDFSMLIQGTINNVAYMSGDFMNGFGNNGLNNAYEYNLDRFTTATAATAKQPRLWIGSNTNNTQTSTFWIKNNDYLRIKDIELGYTLPTKISRKIGIPSVRFFATGLNLFTFAEIYKVRKDVDPEGWGSISPIMKVVNLGVNVKL